MTSNQRAEITLASGFISSLWQCICEGLLLWKVRGTSYHISSCDHRWYIIQDSDCVYMRLHSDWSAELQRKPSIWRTTRYACAAMATARWGRKMASHVQCVCVCVETQSARWQPHTDIVDVQKSDCDEKNCSDFISQSAPLPWHHSVAVRLLQRLLHGVCGLTDRCEQRWKQLDAEWNHVGSLLSFKQTNTSSF